MPWFRVDDRLHSHPKAKAAGLEAMGLWVMLGSYCAAYPNLRGRVDTATVLGHFGAFSRPRSAMKRITTALVSVGLLHEVPGGFCLHDWEDWQPSPESIDAERRQKQEAGRRGGIAKALAAATATAKQTSSDPIRSDPLASSKQDQTPVGVWHSQGSGEGPKSRRGTRLPDGWRPSDEVLAWAKREGIRNVLAPLESFADYWRSAPGSKGVKVDWDATYRTWVRREVETGRLEQRKPTPTASANGASNGHVNGEPLMTAEERAELQRQLSALDDAETPLFAGIFDPEPGA